MNTYVGGAYETLLSKYHCFGKNGKLKEVSMGRMHPVKWRYPIQFSCQR